MPPRELPPAPRANLVGRAGKLTRLSLESLLDELPPGLPPATGSLHTPALDHLSMSGAHFRASYVAPPAQHRMPPALRTLRLTDYSTAQPAFPLAERLRSLATCKRLGKLVLTNLHLNLTPPSRCTAPGGMRTPASRTCPARPSRSTVDSSTTRTSRA